MQRLRVHFRGVSDEMAPIWQEGRKEACLHAATLKISSIKVTQKLGAAEGSKWIRGN